jgi:hypothetical protein
MLNHINNYVESHIGATGQKQTASNISISTTGRITSQQSREKMVKERLITLIRVRWLPKAHAGRVSTIKQWSGACNVIPTSNYPATSKQEPLIRERNHALRLFLKMVTSNVYTGLYHLSWGRLDHKQRSILMTKTRAVFLTFSTL